MYVRAIIILLLMGFPRSASSEELIRATPLTETLGVRAEISGARNVVVGFLSVGETPEEKPYIEAHVPKSWEGSSVCLTLVSQDGRYEAFAEYSVPSSWAGGQINVPLQSSHNDYLSETKRANFAGILSQGSCDERAANIAPLGWNERLQSKDFPSDVQLLINSRAADEVYLIFDNSDDVDCEKTESAVHLAFDFVCEISGEVITSGDVIEVNRIRNGRKDRPHEVRVPAIP